MDWRGRAEARFEACPDGPLGVAVSGGGDSLALLMALVDWATPRARAVHAATVDHGLRPESAAEAAEVAQICAELGVSHRVLTWTERPEVGNLQAAAREARYRLLANWARGEGLGVVFVGHTRNDLAETLLMRIARGSGLDGLAAMAPEFVRDGITFVRPLLHASRADLREDLTARGIAWTDDPSNADPRFDRVRARQALEHLAPLGLTVERLAETAERLAAAREALSRTTEDLMRRRVRWDAAGMVILDTTGWRAVPEDLRFRLVKRVFGLFNGDGYAPRQQAVAEIDGLAGHGATHVAQGVIARAGADTLRFYREPAAVADAAVSDGLWDKRWHINGPPARIGALGEAGLTGVDWRPTGFTREALLTTPALHTAGAAPRSLLLAPPEGYSVSLRYSVPPPMTR
ncbi:MAG: tRNA lysidine(34) synthetase TilS [Pseudomonadota bacterium]